MKRVDGKMYLFVKCEQPDREMLFASRIVEILFVAFQEGVGSISWWRERENRADFIVYEIPDNDDNASISIIPRSSSS